MKNKFILLLFVLIQTINAFAQMPIIKANAKQVTIKDGDYIATRTWTLSPEIRPDVYVADRTREAKHVIFYTDIDSIKVKVVPGSTFDFIVLLNNKDSCYTQIVSAIPQEKEAGLSKNVHDTIPFVLTARNAIHVKAIVNNTDTLNLHFDVGSFDFRFTKDAILRKTGLLSNQPDAMAGKAKANYNQMNKVFQVQMGQLVFNSPEIVVTGLTAHNMDGRFGWNIFEGKCIEIDYEKQILIIHSQLPKLVKGYSKSKINFLHSFVCANGTIIINKKKYNGNFIIDTGSDMAMILDSTWAVKNNFPKDLKIIKTKTFLDPRGNKYESKIISLPMTKINGIALSEVPATLLGSKNPVGFEVNYFGNDFLKRMNTILDFKNDVIYLKANKYMGLPYQERT